MQQLPVFKSAQLPHLDMHSPVTPSESQSGTALLVVLLLLPLSFPQRACSCSMQCKDNADDTSARAYRYADQAASSLSHDSHDKACRMKRMHFLGRWVQCQ
jgi:hypothetical protein